MQITVCHTTHANNRHYVFRPSVRPLSVQRHLFRMTRYLCFSGRISMKLATNIHHVSGRC